MRNLPRIVCFLLAMNLTGCHEVSHPHVDTLYVNGGTEEAEKLEAIPKLYAHYVNSQKDKEAYEVISNGNGRFILNYTPKLELLTLCADPGSGWLNQFKNVKEVTLQKLALGGYSFDSLGKIASDPIGYDSLLIVNEPFINVKTNGSPSL
ncbi:hypothetical protein [Dyadobacter sp. CY326]|uniref:hypothetical protein n=1 Tax=Dyadobacter sp. CY326 TaxID=2907300 RepID=UPI001F2B0157|nr:hypothetical protein [Dyadobacter sp. CY326]MCE7065683.1 hypothetical protein [Dyadobacter sp. CY326]